MIRRSWPVATRQPCPVASVLVAVVAAALSIASIATPAAADRTVSVQPPTTTIALGATFTLVVNVDDANHVAGFQLDISYDESLVSLNRVDPGTLVAGVSGWSFQYNYVILGTRPGLKSVRVLACNVGANELTGGTGSLAIYAFAASGSNSGMTPVYLDNIALSNGVGQSLPAVGADGSVIVFAPSSGALSGQVRERGTSTNIAGANIEARIGAVLRGSATTGANGVYSMPKLAPGTYVVTARTAGYLTQTKANVSVTQGATSYVNFNLDKLCLTGQVRQAGTTTNLAGATVVAYLGSTTTPGATGTTDVNGIYQISALAAGTYTVVASKANYVKQTKPGIAVTAGVVTYVNFSLQPSGKLKGQVKDKASGAPLIGATVVARRDGIIRATATTIAPWGVYEIASDLPAGTYVVGASTTGYLGQTRKDIVVTAGATTYVNFSLQPQ